MARERDALAGREQERAAIRGAIAAVAAGAARMVFVHGEAGIGKTRMLEEAADAARESAFLVLTGGAVPSGVGLPFGPVIEAVRTLVAQLGAGRLADLVDEPVWELLARLDPTRPVPPVSAAEVLAQPRLYAAFSALLSRLAADRPVALVFEDLHWADASTLALLTWVARAARDDPLAIVASWRVPVPTGAPLGAVLPELLRLPSSVDLALGQLGSEATATLLRRLRPELDEASLRRLVAASAGNPFYAVTLAKSDSGERVPPRLAEIFRRALDDASPNAREVLHALTLIARPVEYGLVEAVTGLNPEHLDRALDELLEARLIDAAGAMLQLRHALVGEAIDTALRPGRRRSLHRAVVSALLARAACGERVPPAELARHLSAAGDAEQAAVATLAAAREARQRLALPEAELHFKTVILSPAPGELRTPRVRLDLLLEAADVARWRTGAAGDAECWLDEARAIARDLCDSVALARAECTLGRLLWARGDAPGSLAAYERAAGALPWDASDTVRGRVLAWVATGQMTMSLHAQARATALDALRLVAPAVAAAPRAEAATAPWPRDEEASAIALHALITEASSAAWLGETDVALEGLHTALVIAKQRKDLDAVSRAYGNLTFALAVAGDWHGTAAVAADGLEWTRQLGLDVSGAAVLVNNRISALVALGRWDDAHREAAAALDETPPRGVALTLHLTLAELAACCGDVEASGHLTEAEGLPGVGGDPQLVLYAACARAELALWGEDPESARGVLAAALASAHMRDYPFGTLRLAALALRAEADIAEMSRAPGADTRLEKALTRVEALLQTVASIPASTPSERALQLTARAEAARATGAARGPSDNHAALWTAVDEAWAAAGEVYPRAYARYRQGCALLATSRPRRAVDALAQAEQMAEQLGAHPLARCCGLVARASGLERELRDAVAVLNKERVVRQETRRSTAITLPHLTMRERQVLEQLAQGCTNRVAARRLGISEKTIAVHLTNVYAKLGVTNRTEAVSVALRSGLVVTS